MFQSHLNSFYLIALVLSFFSRIIAYNLNMKEKIVFSDPNRGIFGRESYFGYSVALFSSDSDPVVLVGAPRANVSRLMGISEPGTVFHCHLNGNCTEWILDWAKNGKVRQMKDVRQRLDDAGIGATIFVENSTIPRVVVRILKFLRGILEF